MFNISARPHCSCNTVSRMFSPLMLALFASHKLSSLFLSLSLALLISEMRVATLLVSPDTQAAKRRLEALQKGSSGSEMFEVFSFIFIISAEVLS